MSKGVSFRLKKSDLAAQTIVLKLKTSDFQNFTRTFTLSHPTQRAKTIYDTALHLLSKEVVPHRKFRLLGIGLTKFTEPADADPPNILDINL